MIKIYGWFFKRTRAVLWCMLVASTVMVAHPTEAQTVEYIHTDASGTPVAVTSSSGSVIERSEYAPYGDLLNRLDTDAPGFTGHVQDSSTGMTYMQQRYYDPMTGAFLSVDPVTAATNPVRSFNRYRYANENPYTFIDPDGRDGCKYPYCPGRPKRDSLPIDDGTRKFPIGSESDRQARAYKVIDAVSDVVTSKVFPSRDAAAAYFVNIFQPASTKLGTEFRANINVDLAGKAALSGLGTSTKFYPTTGIGYNSSGVIIPRGADIHTHPEIDLRGVPNSPFSDGDVSLTKGNGGIGYLSTPDMQLYKTDGQKSELVQ